MILQVVLLMWLRTTINWQYKHGGNLMEAFEALYAQGGIGRFYQGASYALLQGPLSRFGDTAANEGIRELLNNSGLSVGTITFCASMAASLWRIVLTPVDTIKTTLQVAGPEGLALLREKVSKFGILTLYDGALGNWGANLVGHYPWFVVNNQLEQIIPNESNKYKLVRRAFIGFCSSVVSDCCSNGVRVMKVYKQTSDTPLGYMETIKLLLGESGPAFVVRGLGVKILSNALSGILFSVLWKMIMERLDDNNAKGRAKDDDGATVTGKQKKVA